METLSGVLGLLVSDEWSYFTCLGCQSGDGGKTDARSVGTRSGLFAASPSLLSLNEFEALSLHHIIHYHNVSSGLLQAPVGLRTDGRLTQMTKKAQKTGAWQP